MAASTINIPKLPLKQETFSNNSLANNTFHFEEVAGTKFAEFLSRNLISALSCTGNIQHPESLLRIDIPYFWCNYCSYKTIQKAEMLEHMHCHRFHCQFCEFSAFTRCEVLKHSQSNHQRETNFRLFWFCMLNSDKSLVEVHDKTEQELTHTSKRTRETESKKTEVVLLKKIKLEKPDGELLETSVEVPRPELNQLPTSPSDTIVSQRMEKFRNTLSQISDEMNGVSGHADPFDTQLPKSTSNHLNDNAESADPQGSFLRTILTTEDNHPKPTSELPGRNGIGIVSKISAHTDSFPAEPVVKIEIIDDQYDDNHVSYPKVIEEKSLTTFLRKSDLNPPKSSSPDPANLPILRTMLQCTEILSSSTASSLSGEGSQDGTTSGNKKGSVDLRLSDESENDNENNDNENDADYMPNRNDSSGEEWSYSKKGKGKKRKRTAAYSCPNCSVVHYTFKPTKTHLFRVHPNANLVLKEEFSNMYVFICPISKCSFRSSVLKTFVRHLERCDVFSEKKIESVEGNHVINSLLVTYGNILERSKVPWMYACCLCATKFMNFSNAVSHTHGEYLTCPLSDCLFKLRDKTAVLYCKHCKAEFSISNWRVLVNKNCKNHKLSDANLTLDKSSPVINLLPSTSTPQPSSETESIPKTPLKVESITQPPSKADSTPQLRAMLQRKTDQVNEADVEQVREQSPDTENLPASRMLQWLMSEGGRMMHMLK